MHELHDVELLRRYTEQNSEEAFAALVERHVSKVYSVALRHTRNPHQAEEITQTVFVILARKSHDLSDRVILEGWLYKTARLTAVTLIRSEIRRARREQEAHMQTLLNENESEVWTQIAPLLDVALAGLNENDRHAVVLRFFYGKSMKEVGAALGASEDAAKMRLNRAVEKLRRFFTKHGVVLSVEVLTTAISANSVQAAPTALAKTATAVAFTRGATASDSTLTLIKGSLKIMAWTKAKTAIVVGVGVLLVAGTTITVVKTEQRETQKVALIEEMPVKEQMSAMKMLVFPAIMKFAQAHQDELPKSLTDLKPYLPESLNGVDDDHWEILQSGKVTPEFVTQRNLILLQQKNVPPEKSKIIVYADGHIEYKK